MGEIYIDSLRCHAFHGVLPQEQKIGNDYVLNVTVTYPILCACQSDEVSDTMSYADLAEVIKAEMSVPSKLLEHVAYRICTAILERFPKTEKVRLNIEKIAPPMSVDCRGAGVILELQNKK